MKAVFANGEAWDQVSAEERYMPENSESVYTAQISGSADQETADALAERISGGISSVEIRNGEDETVKTLAGYSKVICVVDQIQTDGKTCRTLVLGGKEPYGP